MTAMRYRTWLIAFVLAGSTGCKSGPTAVQMTGSLDVPSAQGTVTASRVDNHNTSLRVDVRHLAVPDRVTPGATTYVVWARGSGQEAFQNVGALTVDQDLHGTLKTLTPYANLDVVVTAEVSAMATEPSSKQVLTASVRTPGG